MSDTNTGTTTTDAGTASSEANAAPNTEPAIQQDPQQTAQEGAQQPAAEPGDKATAKVPEAPAIEVKLPEGVEPNEALLGVLKETAKDSASAQRLVDAFIEIQQQAVAAEEQKQEAWKQEVAAIKDLDTKGIKRAMERYGTPELAAELEAAGVGNLPSLVKLLNAVGKATKDDSIAGTTGGGANHIDEKEAQLRRAYPSLFKE
ncbi:MAG TPA: hypothetical protein VN033_10285 [Vulgatibacter sp.]|nr:hypothetical protein [Vulgatibacter sp.]